MLVYFNLNFAEASSETLFASQLALIFKTYHVRYTKNKFKKFNDELAGLTSNLNNLNRVYGGMLSAMNNRG